jgi:hypothetical protein
MPATILCTGTHIGPLRTWCLRRSLPPCPSLLAVTRASCMADQCARSSQGLVRLYASVRTRPVAAHRYARARFCSVSQVEPSTAAQVPSPRPPRRDPARAGVDDGRDSYASPYRRSLGWWVPKDHGRCLVQRRQRKFSKIGHITLRRTMSLRIRSDARVLLRARGASATRRAGGLGVEIRAI